MKSCSLVYNFNLLGVVYFDEYCILDSSICLYFLGNLVFSVNLKNVSSYYLDSNLSTISYGYLI